MDFGNSAIWQLTAESAEDFGDFMIRIGRRDRSKSFLPTLNWKKAEIRPSIPWSRKKNRHLCYSTTGLLTRTQFLARSAN